MVGAYSCIAHGREKKCGYFRQSVAPKVQMAVESSPLSNNLDFRIRPWSEGEGFAGSAKGSICSEFGRGTSSSV